MLDIGESWQTRLAIDHEVVFTIYSSCCYLAAQYHDNAKLCFFNLLLGSKVLEIFKHLCRRRISCQCLGSNVILFVQIHRHTKQMVDTILWFIPDAILWILG